MTAQGVIYTALHSGEKYYYLPTVETWTLEMKRISLGDIYFSNALVQLQLGHPKKPDMKDFPDLHHVKTKSIKISLE